MTASVEQHPRLPLRAHQRLLLTRLRFSHELPGSMGEMIPMMGEMMAKSDGSRSLVRGASCICGFCFFLGGGRVSGPS